LGVSGGNKRRFTLSLLWSRVRTPTRLDELLPWNWTPAAGADWSAATPELGRIRKEQQIAVRVLDDEGGLYGLYFPL